MLFHSHSSQARADTHTLDPHFTRYSWINWYTWKVHRARTFPIHILLFADELTLHAYMGYGFRRRFNSLQFVLSGGWTRTRLAIHSLHASGDLSRAQRSVVLTQHIFLHCVHSNTKWHCSAWTWTLQSTASSCYRELRCVFGRVVNEHVHWARIPSTALCECCMSPGIQWFISIRTRDPTQQERTSYKWKRLQH